MAETSNESNSVNLITNIKSLHILKQIFINLLTNKLLNFMRYNKNLQIRLNKDIDDYRSAYSKIVIEIIPIDCNYIIFDFKHDESYYHIYINDNKKEINRDDINKYDIDIFTVGSDWEGVFDFLKEFCEVIYLPRTECISSTLRKQKIREM